MEFARILSVIKILRGIKIRLLPTPEQEILFRKSAGTARWAYNYFLSENQRTYQETGHGIKEGEVRKYINNVLKKTTHKWLSGVSNKVMAQGVKDASLALQRFFNGVSGYPRFKSRHGNKASFYVNYESLKRKQHGFQGERLGYVKTTEPLPKVKGHYSNPRISYDGRYWYLSVCYEVKPIQTELTGESIGIDLGVKELAVVSTGKIYGNINKTKRIRQLKKRLRRQQRQLSRRIKRNISGYTISEVIGKDGQPHEARKPVYDRSLSDCKNVERQQASIRRTYKRLTDIRNNYLHQTTTAIVKTKPSRIVMEDLNVHGLMKNRHLSKAIAEQKWYEFIRQIKYKCEMYGIVFLQADRFYASSRTCSCCGYVNRQLKLSGRTYRCPECGLVIDRDLNAAINLANYSEDSH